jgi:regulatory protein
MDQYEKFYTLTLRFLQLRARSEKEIRDYLLKKRAPSEIIEIVVRKLREYNFLNDRQFARMWIESRKRFHPKSTSFLVLELRRKGIAKEIIDEELSARESDMDLKLALQVVSQKIQRYRHLDRRKVYQRLGSILIRRGFGFDVAKRAIDEVLRKEYTTKE